MNTIAKIVTTISVSILLTGLTACELEDHDDDHGDGKTTSFNASRLDVAPVQNLLYKEECGSCHFAYQPGLLPARSWQRIMTKLDNHFGENAELDIADRKAIEEYLMKNAAEFSSFKRPQKILASVSESETPLRISQTRYFIRKHHELKKSMVEGNPKVKSFSACDACHVKADTGSFNEHEVRIPGYGSWDD